MNERFCSLYSYDHFEAENFRLACSHCYAMCMLLPSPLLSQFTVVFAVTNATYIHTHTHTQGETANDKLTNHFSNRDDDILIIFVVICWLIWVDVQACVL